MTPVCPRCGAKLAPHPSISHVLLCALCLTLVSGGSGEAPAPAAPAAEPAHVSGKVLGFRVWALDGYKLLSANTSLDAHWRIGVNEAQCLAHKTFLAYGYEGETRPHEAPHPACQCGLYALHEPHAERPASDLRAVYGAVLAWGRIEVHAEGFRAQYAEPVILAYRPRQPYEDVKRAEAIASEMALPFVALPELAAKAAAFGQPIAPEHRPTHMRLPEPHMYLRGGGSVGFPMPMPVATANYISPYSYVGYSQPVTPLPPRRRPPRRFAVAANGSAAVFNLTWFAPSAHWISLVCGIVSAAITGIYARRGWRQRG